MRTGNTKFCPRCGAQIHISDGYCTRCGYSFRGRGKKSNFKTIIIAVIILAIAWVLIRTITKQDIIPSGLMSLFKNMTSNKTG